MSLWDIHRVTLKAMRVSIAALIGIVGRLLAFVVARFAGRASRGLVEQRARRIDRERNGRGGRGH